MRVALVAPFGLRPKGTTAARVLPIASVLARCGAEVTVFIPPWDDPARAAASWREHDVSVVHTVLGSKLLSPCTILRDLRRRIRDLAPDVVHAFKPIGYSGAVAWLAMRRGIGGRRPLVVVDADDVEGPAGWARRRNPGVSGWLRGTQERLTLRTADRVTVASAWLAGYASRLGRAPSEVLRIPNGHAVMEADHIPSPQLTDATGPPVLLWYTRFTEADPRRVAALLVPILAAHAELRLAVLGEGLVDGAEAAFQRAADSAGFGFRIDWLGYRPGLLEEYVAGQNGNLIAIYPMDNDLANRARCPSKLPHLMGLGVPVVAEAVGEVAVYLDAVGPRSLAPAGDAPAFRSRVQDLVLDRRLRAVLAHDVVNAAARWSWTTAAGGLMAWYRDSLSTLGVA